MPTARPVQAQPDPDRVLPHLALRALVSLRAVDACLEAIDGPHREGALRALRYLHEPKAVEGLIKKLNAGPLPRCAATSWRPWSACIIARRITKGAGGESGPTRPAPITIPGSGNAARGSPSVLKSAVSRRRRRRPSRSSAASWPGIA